MQRIVCTFFGFSLFALVLALAPPRAAFAMNTDTTPTKSTSEEAYFKAGELAIKAWKWPEAIDLMQKVLKENPNNADAYNYIGYANRHLKKYDAAFANYQKALKLNPEHRGALEYLGEAYLQTGDLAGAEKQLKALDGICFFGCKEYDALKAAIADYKAKKG